jgi:hypothetical protein
MLTFGLLDATGFTKSLFLQGFLACPARFERATYALEAVKMRLNNTKNNGISLARSGVASAPRILVRVGIGRSRVGIGRWLDVENLSGKPTNMGIEGSDPKR